MPLTSWVRRALNFLGIDPAVAAILVGNIGIGVLAPIQIYLIAKRFTKTEQGVHFNYLAFFQIMLLFDLGFGLVVQQLVSHERAFLHETPARVLDGESQHHSRLASLLHITMRWYAGLFAVVAALMIPVGWWFFARSAGLEKINWQAGWVLTVLVTGLCAIAIGFCKFLSGCGDILAVARVSTLQILSASVGLCVVLVLGGQLLTFAGSQAFGLVVPLIWLVTIRRPLLADLWRTRPGDARLTWFRDVRPFQSRIALSLISVQAFQLIIPVTLRCFGPEESGRLGVTLSVLAALQMLGLSWLETRVPVFGNLIAKKDWAELDRVYRHVLVKSTAFIATAMGLLVVAVYIPRVWDHPDIEQMASRFLAPRPGVLLALIVLANHVFFVRAAYLRAHCKEPYLSVTVLQGLALVVTMVVVGRYGTLEMMLGGCLFWTVVIGQGLGYGIFRLRRREWHAPA